MLPATARMRRRQDFELAIRRGRRAAGNLLTVYLYAGGDGRDKAYGHKNAATAVGAGEQMAAERTSAAEGSLKYGPERASPRVGFMVSKAVGGAVVRNRVRRRLREVARMRTGQLPAGSLLVIRANPRAAEARQRDLAADLDLALGRLVRRQVRA